MLRGKIDQSFSPYVPKNDLKNGPKRDDSGSPWVKSFLFAVIWSRANQGTSSDVRPLFPSLLSRVSTVNYSKKFKLICIMIKHYQISSFYPTLWAYCSDGKAQFFLLVDSIRAHVQLYRHHASTNSPHGNRSQFSSKKCGNFSRAWIRNSPQNFQHVNKTMAQWLDIEALEN